MGWCWRSEWLWVRWVGGWWVSCRFLQVLVDAEAGLVDERREGGKCLRAEGEVDPGESDREIKRGGGWITFFFFRWRPFSLPEVVFISAEEPLPPSIPPYPPFCHGPVLPSARLEPPQVWSFGAGHKGQLGHESTTREDFPRLVQALKRTRYFYRHRWTWELPVGHTTSILPGTGGGYSWVQTLQTGDSKTEEISVCLYVCFTSGRSSLTCGA